MIFVVFYLYQPVKKTFMKINRKLIAAFAMLSVVFGACTTDQTVDCGIKSNLTAPSNVVWDEYASTKTALAFTWDASAAIAAGATSFTAQVVKPNMETMGEGELHDFITPDQYDSAVSVVLPVTTNYLGSLNVNENDAACDQVVFDNIQNGKQYMLRVRANYPNSNYSEWQWVMDDITSEVAHIKPGKGLVDPTEADDKNPPVVKITDITAADAIVLWSVTDFKSTSADFGMEYILTLNKGSELVVKYHFSANSAVWSSYARNGCAFKFTALEPETEYNVLVQNVTEGTQPLEVTKFTTAKSPVVVMPEAPAAAGDVILYEDFAELILTADLSRGAAGISSGIRNTADGTWKPTGDLTHILDDDNSDTEPTDANPLAWYLCEPSTEVGMFNTIKGLIANSRLATWGMMAEDDTKGAICARSSHVKMGASSKCAWLVLPEIKCLQQTATVELSFDAALYETDPGTVIVEMLTGCTQLSNAENSFVRPSDRMTVSTFKVGKDWTHYTFTVDNVNNGARLAIGGHRNGVDGQHRFYLDNIEVKVVSYGDLKLAAPKNVVVNPTDTTAEVLWDKVNSAEQYIVEYTSVCDACGQPVWKALPATTATKVEIEGLAFETEYAVRVKAVAGEVVSEYCEPVSFTTLAEIKKLKTPKDVTVVAGLGAVELSLPAVTKATNYEVYAAEALVASSFVESADKVVTITIPGLTPDTDYSFAIKATADGTDMESSDLSEVIAAKTGNITALRTPGLEYKPTSLTIEWTDFRADHAYNVQLADAEGVLGAWDVTIKASTVYAGTSTMIPARFTFGALTPATEYTVSVKAKGADDATYGAVKFTTDAVRPAGAKDVYWNGFDDCFFGGDGHNVASAVVSASGDALKLIDWPATTRYIYENVVSKTAVDGPGDANRTSAIQSYATADPECSLYGWKLAGSEVHSGFLKVGAGGTIGTVTTNVLGDKVLNASSATACTISFKVSPRSDSNPCNKPVKVEVVHEDGTTTLVAAGLEVITDGDSYGHVWRTHTLSGVQLKSTDKIRISGDVEKATGECRFHLDDLLVVAE